MARKGHAGSLDLIIWTQQPALALINFSNRSQEAEIVEVSPPVIIQQLQSSLATYQPQVTILSPAADQLLKDDRVVVRFQVKDLPIFKDPKWGLGPHLEVLLDNQPAQALYDLNQPLNLEELAPGTHTLRAFAARPWGESFKILVPMLRSLSMSLRPAQTIIPIQANPC